MLFCVSGVLPHRFTKSRRALTAITLGAITALSIATPVRAGLFDDEEARQQIIVLRGQLGEVQRALDARLSELEAQARNRSIIDLFNQVETLRAEFARLRGQLELVQNELEVAQKRQRDLYVDLDGRMRKLETAAVAAEQARAAQAAAAVNTAPTTGLPTGNIPAPSTTSEPSRAAPPAVFTQPPTSAPTQPVVDPALEQRAYDQGLEHFRSARFGEAVTQFQLFIRGYPRSPLASSAQYWIGNSLYATRDFRGAIAAQRQLLNQYPDSNKAPDALLNIATSQSEIGDLQGARATLQEVNAKYPSSEAAAKARQRLGIR
jgi:tol-pal system protein YbgF